MKIKYDASRETFKYYNELTVISQRLKKIEKAGNIIIVNQIFKCILYIFVFAFYIFVVDRIEPTIFTNILKYISIYFLVSYLSYMILFIKNYKVFKDGNVGGTLIINENTITDEFNKCKIELEMDQISSIIIGKYSININFNTPKTRFIFPIQYKDKIVTSIKKYKEDVRVIEL